MSALPSTGRADAGPAVETTRDLYEQYRSRIFAYCVSRLGSREEAEDATQTTFLNAFRSLRSGVVPEFELAWLFRIAENVCRDGNKSASRRRRHEASRDVEDVQEVSAPARNDDGLVGLADALAGMPERQRRAILLREWRGLSYAEIATELGLSNAAVETLIFRARRTLAHGLEAPRLRRRASGFNVLSLLGMAKSALQGGAAAKVAATAIAVGGAAAVVTVPLGDQPRPASTRSESRPAAPSRAEVDSRVASRQGDVVPSLPARPRAHPSRRVREAPVLQASARSSPTPSGKADVQLPSAPSPTGAQPAAQPAPVATAGQEVPTPEAPAPSPVPPVASPPPPPVAPELPAVPELPPVVPPTAPLAPPPALPEPPVELPDLPPLLP